MKINILKDLIEGMKKNFSCPTCSNDKISDDGISIVGIAGMTANIDFSCPNCQKHFMTQVNIMNISDFPILGKNNFQDKKINENFEKKIILDKDIVDLTKKLKSQKNMSITDLLNK